MINSINGNQNIDANLYPVSQNKQASKPSKVEEIKLKIQSGTYKLDLDQTAQKVAKYFS